MDRIELEWMMKLMCDCSECPAREVAALGIDIGNLPAVAGDTLPSTGSAGDSAAGNGDLPIIPAEQAPPSGAEEVGCCQDIVIKAISWAVGTDDDGLALALQDALPACIVQEQIRLYKARVIKACGDDQRGLSSPMRVDHQRLESRKEVARVFRRSVFSRQG